MTHNHDVDCWSKERRQSELDAKWLYQALKVGRRAENK